MAKPLNPPIPDRREQVRQEIKQRVVRIEEDWLATADLLLEVVEGKYYEYWKFLTPEEYFQEEVGMAPRTVWKRLAVARSLCNLPAQAVELARKALAHIGPSKAVILAPALEKEPKAWQHWTEMAAGVNEARLQAVVSRMLGLKPRGAILEPGEKTFRYLLSVMPDQESRELLEQFFEAGRQHTGSKNFVGVLLAAFQECLGSWS